MNDVVFRSYDQEALDIEYNNRAKVPDTQDYKDVQARVSETVRAEYAARLDVAYGPGPDDRVDIYPAAGDGPSPVHVFFHGGYWRQNHRQEFAFVAHVLAPAGAVVVVVEYTLIPEVDLDALVDQCRRCMAWVWNEAASFGGDRDNITVSGHSAGGHLTVMMMATDWPAYSPGLPANLVKAGCAISGIYDLEPVRLSFQNEILGFTPDIVARNSPMFMDPKGGGSLLLPVGGLEGPEFIRQSEEMAAAWRDKGMDAMAWVMDGLHHFSTINQIIDPDSELTEEVKAQMDLD
jgi:arylformamidase